ncbi:MAG: beta-N-acetylhexosaminidase [Acidothermaceae bacterium]
MKTPLVSLLAIALIGAVGAACTSHASGDSVGPGGGAGSTSASSTAGSAATASSSAGSSSSGSGSVSDPSPGPATGGGAITADLVPLPVFARTDSSVSFTLTKDTTIVTGPGTGVAAVGDDLAADLRPATGFAAHVTAGGADSRPNNSFVLLLESPSAQGASTVGDEGYDLKVSAKGVVIAANTAAGLFHGVQTLRQLLPGTIEARTAQPGPWRIVGGEILDYPRFAYRGAMLDVTRHFFPVTDVERYIDELALYKVNTLHLHLSDDQGWRIAIDSWPNLALHGGSGEVGSTTKGGYYTQADYTTIVQYAQAHFMTIVPEIDTPSHTNAALSSYPELNCNGVAPPFYTGEQVGFSSLCVGKAVTYKFLDDVVAELAALTPGPYIHLGGDEAHSTSSSDYVTFVQKAQAIVEAHGKKLMGWAEISQAKLDPGTVAEYWNFSDHGVSETDAVQQGVKIVAAPANHAYLDQKYNAQTTLGLNWAGDIEVQDAYAWDPTDGGRVSDSGLLGVEAPLWSETLHTMADIEYMAWPRMAGIAEIGWTPKAERSWNTYKLRLANQGPRWAEMGINFYRSSQVPWAS